MSKEIAVPLNSGLAVLARFESTWRERPGGGHQFVARFPNGRGVSVVRGPGTYGVDFGLWELAVVRFHGPGLFDWQLDYTTPATYDVEGWLSPERVVEMAEQVAALPVITGE